MFRDDHVLATASVHVAGPVADGTRASRCVAGRHSSRRRYVRDCDDP